MATARTSRDAASGTGAASSLGLVLAGVALAAAVLPWTGQPPLVDLGLVDGSALAAALALVATTAFALRRYGVLDRPVGSAVAGAFSLAVAAVALYRLLTPAVGNGGTPDVGPGLPVAALAGLFGVAAAVADWRAVADDQLWARVRAFGVALLVGFLGFATTIAVVFVVGSPIVLGVEALTGQAPGRSVETVVTLVGFGLGSLAFTALYLRYRDLDWGYVDVEKPTVEDGVYALAGVVLLFVMTVVVGILFQQLGIQSAPSSIERDARAMQNPAFLLALVPLSLLIIGPAEELVYRNIVQKYLYEAFSRRMAVLFGSIAFAIVHFQQYANPDPVAMLSTLSVVFVLSLILGYTYHKTENLVVPIVIHGVFNAIQFLALYAQLTMDLPAG